MYIFFSFSFSLVCSSVYSFATLSLFIESDIERIDLKERTDRLSSSKLNEFLLWRALFLFDSFDSFYLRLASGSSDSVLAFAMICFDLSFLTMILGTAHTYFIGGLISLSLLLSLNSCLEIEAYSEFDAILRYARDLSPYLSSMYCSLTFRSVLSASV